MNQPELSKAAEAASLLLAVRRGGPRLSALPPAVAPQNLAEAYAIQHEVLHLQGASIAGWKATLFNASDGICAPLAGHAVHNAPANLLATQLPTLNSFEFGIEPEVAFTLGNDLPPLPTGARYEREVVCAAVASAHAAIEMIGSRYLEVDAVSQLEQVADSYMNELLVLGPSCPAWRKLDLADLPLEIRVDGKVVYQGRGGHPLADPVLPLVWLANHLSQLGSGLRAGEVITTGSCNGVRALKLAQTIGVFFAGLGSALLAVY